MMRLAIDCRIDCDGWAELKSLPLLAEETIAAALAESGDRVAEGAEVSLLFCDDARMSALNRQFRGKDAPTNVLSFPGPDPLETALVLGDIAIAHETVRREAIEQGKRIEDHCRHMIVHGFLHLLGHDHEDDGEAEIMEALEIRALRRLGVADPYRRDDEHAAVDNERA